MGNVSFVIDEFRNIIAIILAELALTVGCFKRRNHFWIIFPIGLVACLGISSIYVLLHNFFETTENSLLVSLISFIWYLIMFSLSALFINRCFKISYLETIWILLSGYAAQHLCYAAIYELVFGGAFVKEETNIVIKLLVYFGFALVVDAILHLIFRRILNDDRHLPSVDNLKNRILFTALFVVIFVVTLLNQLGAMVQIEENTFNLNYFAAISDVFFCIIVIAAQYIILTGLQSRAEKELAVKLFENEKRQYETFKSTVEYINIKCHDLKHELRSLQNNPQKIEESLEQLSIFDAFADTGNKIIDSILTEKSIICLNQNISLSYMADASGLSLDEQDCYALFGNLLDNAIDATKDAASDNKFIRLFIKRENNMNVIHIENYVSKLPRFINGMPITRHKNKTYHGFGTKSVVRIVEKYGGEVRFTASNNLFNVDIFIPETTK